MQSQGVVFFDGYCGVCDAVVSRLLSQAERGGLRFAPLQGETFKDIADRFPRLKGVDSVVFVEHYGDADRESAYVRGRAVKGVLRHLGGWWTPLRWITAFVPIPVMDFFYDRVAKYRNRIAQRRDSCRLPTDEERALFLP